MISNRLGDERVVDENTPNSKRNRLPAKSNMATKKRAIGGNLSKRIENNRKITSEDNVKVYVRVRPHSSDPGEANSSSISAASKNEIYFDNGVKKFSVDHVFDKKATQSNIFSKIGKPIVDSALQGYNGTVLAYGQTGSGKTYTMLGSPAEPGLIPRVCQYLFDAIQKSNGERNTKNHQEICTDKINVCVSYLEIYQENVLDLLDVESGKKDIREDTKKKCVYVAGLVEKEVHSPKEAAEWMVCITNKSPSCLVSYVCPNNFIIK